MIVYTMELGWFHSGVNIVRKKIPMWFSLFKGVCSVSMMDMSVVTFYVVLVNTTVVLQFLVYIPCSRY